MLLLHVYLINNNWIQCCFGRLNPQLAGQILFCPDVSAEHYYTIKYMETTTFKNYFEQWTYYTGFRTGTVSGGGTEDCVKAIGKRGGGGISPMNIV